MKNKFLTGCIGIRHAFAIRSDMSTPPADPTSAKSAEDFRKLHSALDEFMLLEGVRISDTPAERCAFNRPGLRTVFLECGFDAEEFGVALFDQPDDLVLIERLMLLREDLEIRAAASRESDPTSDSKG